MVGTVTICSVCDSAAFYHRKRFIDLKTTTFHTISLTPIRYKNVWLFHKSSEYYACLMSEVYSDFIF